MDPKGLKPVCIADLVALMENIAPPHLAESWDNCGLQVGARRWPVKKVWVALDPLPSVVEAAAAQDVDLVITHHPLIFKPLLKIDPDTPEGKIIATALNSRMGIFAAHTNLDSARGGINDILARKFGLTDLDVMLPAAPTGIGEAEMSTEGAAGMGRLGRLDPSMTVARLAQVIKKRLALEKVRVAGQDDLIVDKVAVCSGSGGSLLSDFLATDAQVFVSGDLRYHDARTVEHAGRALIDIGHFPSEHVMVEALVNRLTQAVSGSGWDVCIEPCRLEKDPFDLI